MQASPGAYEPVGVRLQEDATAHANAAQKPSERRRPPIPAAHSARTTQAAQEAQAAHILLAAAVGASARTQALEELQRLVDQAPTVLLDRGASRVWCSRCQVELRVVAWQVVHRVQASH